MWELKNLSNKEYMEGFKDGIGFAIVAALSITIVLSVTVGITLYALGG